MKRWWVIILLMFCCSLVLCSFIEARPFNMELKYWGVGGNGISNASIVSEQVEIEGEIVDGFKADYTVTTGNRLLEVWISKSVPCSCVNTPITFWVYGNGSDRKVLLRVMDETGEYFQFDGPKIDWEGYWQKVEFNDFSNPSAIWGGNNDKKMDGHIRIQSICIDYWANPEVETNTFRLAKVEVGVPDDMPSTPTKVHGRVFFETKSGISGPLSSAQVKITDINHPSFTYSTKTDSQGYFELPEVWGGECEVLIYRPDYTVYREQIVLTEAPSFEINTVYLEMDYIGSEPDTWFIWEDGNNPPIFGMDSTEFNSGAGSIKGTGVDGGTWIATEYIPVNPQAEYELSCWIKTDSISKEDGAIITIIQITPEVDTNLGWWTGTKKIISVGGTSDWEKYTVRLPKPDPLTGRVRIVLSLDSDVTGTVWFDDLTLRPLPGIVSIQADKPAISSALGQTVKVQFEMTTGAFATLEVYNEQGQLVRTSMENQPFHRTGIAEWDGKIDGDQPAPEGTYKLRLTIADGDDVDYEELIVVVKNSGPSVELTYPVSEYGPIQNNRDFIVVEGKVALDETGTAVVKVFRKVNGVEEAVEETQTQQDGSFSCLAPLSSEGDGVNELWVVAYDTLGNPGEPSASVFVMYAPEFLYGLLKVENKKLISPKNDQGGITTLRVSFYASPETTSTMEIKDASGKLIFAEEQVFADEDEEIVFAWNGKDMEGNWVRDGLYDYKVIVADGSQIVIVIEDIVEVDNTPPVVPLLQYPQAGSTITENKPVLKWKAAADAEYYLIALGDSEEWHKVSVAEFPITEPLAQGTWRVRIKAVDKAYNESITDATFTIAELDTSEFSIANLMVGPNPINLRPTGVRNQLAVTFTLQHEAKVVIGIYNLAGATIKTWDLGELDTGDHLITWDGKDAKGRLVEAGSYLLRLVATNEAAGGEVVISRPILCLR